LCTPAVRTKSMMLCFGGPSFHDASGLASCANAKLVRRSVGIGSAASAPSRARRVVLKTEPFGAGFICPIRLGTNHLAVRLAATFKKKRPRCPLHREKQRGARPTSALIARVLLGRLFDLGHDTAEVVALRRLERRELLERLQVLEPQLL